MLKKETDKERSVKESTLELSDEALDTVAGGVLPLYHTERPETRQIKNPWKTEDE